TLTRRSSHVPILQTTLRGVTNRPQGLSASEVGPMSAQLNPSNALTPTDKALELSELTESQVIARAKLGDADAISALYERYEPKIRRYVLGRLGDPNLAEDICSDVFVKVLESLDRYEDRGWPFSAWLYR